MACMAIMLQDVAVHARLLVAISCAKAEVSAYELAKGDVRDRVVAIVQRVKASFVAYEAKRGSMVTARKNAINEGNYGATIVKLPPFSSI